MAKQSRVTLRGEVYSSGAGTVHIAPYEVQNDNAPQTGDYYVVLSNGFNTITVPSTAKGAYIEFQDGSTVTKTLKGITGDTGILLNPTSWNVLNFGSSPPASFGITTSAADTGYYTRVTFF